MSAAIDAFWRAAQAAHPGLVGPFAVKRIGTSAEICERLLALILSGQKTGTFTLPWLHGRHPDWIPRTGGLMIYIDFSDTPRALIRQKTPEFVRYDQIDASHVACEGPGARDPKVWRDIHWPYWTAQLKDYGLAPSSDMPVCVERFELIHPPSPAALFWAKARAARPDLKLGDRYRTRCIGGTRETNQLILGYIKSGEKVGTFPLPWQLQKTGEPMPKPGDFTIQLDIDGAPQLVVRTTSVAVKPFNDIDAADTAIDGPPVRPLDVWRRVHVPYYSQVLTGLGLAFSEDMPVCVERFELVYAP